jgi:hypothetical protein
VVNRTSDSLNCHTVFGESRKALVEHNKILIQLGTIDTLDGSWPDAAIIREHGTAIILNLVSSKKSGDLAQQFFAGQGYKLSLAYRVKYLDNGTPYNDPYYDGTCTVWHGKQQTEINVQGVKNKL